MTPSDLSGAVLAEHHVHDVPSDLLLDPKLSPEFIEEPTFGALDLAVGEHEICGDGIGRLTQT